jgi:hypothetical protein
MRWFQRSTYSEIGADLRRLLQHGVHVQRGACRFTPAASATLREISSRPRAILVFRWSALDYSTSQGYFRQVIDKDGATAGAVSLITTPDSCRLRPVRRHCKRRMAAARDQHLPGYSLWLRAWQAQVGRVKLYLLDSNDAANISGIHRAHYERVVRWRPRASPSSKSSCSALADGVCSSALGHAAGGLPSQRRPRSVCRAGACTLGFRHETAQLPSKLRIGWHSCGESLHHAHGSRRRVLIASSRRSSTDT